MTIWSAEIKELESLYSSIKDQFPELEKELERLIKAVDENMVMVYARRCLEVIITDLCESELRRPRKTEPLKGIIDKLHHEEKIPSHIIASMQNLNSLSSFGAHPKEYDPRQVKPVLNNLATIIEWYLKYKKGVEVSEVKETEQVTVKDEREKATSLSEQKTDNIFRILWKKGVPQLTAGYFIASWIIIRFLDWMLARYDISTQWADVMLIILMAMIPSVLLYIYNRNRINRGKLSLVEKIAFPSNIIITIILVLLLSKGTDLQAMTEAVTVVNEYNEKETHRVFKEEYVTKKLKIFPFRNETNNSTQNWVGFGIREALYEDFLQFDYMIIDIRNVEVAYNFLFEENYYELNKIKHLREQIKDAVENNCPYFLTGTYRVKDGYYEITSQLYQTSSGIVENEKTFRGKDLFNLIDSISIQARIDLGVSQNILNVFPDLPVKDHMTNNPDAFCKYIEGLQDWSSSPRNYDKIRQAVDIDTTFVLPLIHLSKYNLFYQASDVTARKDINHAMRHRERLSEYRNIETRVLYYEILGEIEKAAKLMEMSYRLQPYNSTLLEMLWDFSDNYRIFSSMVETAEQLNKMVPDYPKYQWDLARSYQLSGQFDKGIKIIEKLLEVNPENIEALLLLGELCLMESNYTEAEKIYTNLILQYPEKEKFWSLMLDHIAFARTHTVDPPFLNQFSGIYIYDTRRIIETNFVLKNKFLVNKPITQGSVFLFPVSDSQFTSVWSNWAMLHTFIKDSNEKIIKQIHQESRVVDPRTRPGSIVWKQDSLIMTAEKLVQTNQVREALTAFRKAYDQNPEHYYLANYIKHLEFIQSPEFEECKQLLNSYTGSYTGQEGVWEIINENDRFYYMNQRFYEWEILPLTEDLFMVPDRYNMLIKIVKENNSIKGIKVIYRDGREAFYSKNN